LRQRLKLRGTEDPESLKQRIGKAEFEMTFSNKFDNVIVNDRLIKATAEAKELVVNFLK